MIGVLSCHSGALYRIHYFKHDNISPTEFFADTLISIPQVEVGICWLYQVDCQHDPCGQPGRADNLLVCMNEIRCMHTSWRDWYTVCTEAAR